MRRAVLYTLPFVASLGASYAQPELLKREASTVCEEIAAAISSESAVYYAGAHCSGILPQAHADSVNGA